MFDTKMNIETSGYPIRRLFISDKVKEIYLYMKRTSVAEPEVCNHVCRNDIYTESDIVSKATLKIVKVK